MSEGQHLTETPAVEEIRRLFLGIKFSHKDAANLDKRIKSSRIRRIDGRAIRDVRQGLTGEEFKTHILNLRQTLLLNELNVENLSAVICGENTAVLEEVHPSPDLFGYVAAANIGGSVDVVHVAVKADWDVKTSWCGCCVSNRQRKLKHDYIEALVFNFMRIKVIEQLRIEGLTTRGQHHRKGRFKAKKKDDVNHVNSNDDDQAEAIVQLEGHHDGGDEEAAAAPVTQVP